MHFRHGQTDGLASWHKRDVYTTSRAENAQHQPAENK